MKQNYLKNLGDKWKSQIEKDLKKVGIDMPNKDNKKQNVESVDPDNIYDKTYAKTPSKAPSQSFNQQNNSPRDNKVYDQNSNGEASQS